MLNSLFLLLETILVMLFKTQAPKCNCLIVCLFFCNAGLVGGVITRDQARGRLGRNSRPSG